MRCIEVIELMQRNLDGDLSEQEFKMLEDHLVTCSECRSLNEELTKLAYDLESLPEIDPPFSLVDTILPQLSTQLTSSIPLIETRKKPKKMYWAVGASAAAVLVAALIGPWGTTDSDLKKQMASAPQKDDADTEKSGAVPNASSHSDKNLAGIAMDQQPPKENARSGSNEDEVKPAKSPEKGATSPSSAKPAPRVSKTESKQATNLKEPSVAQNHQAPAASEKKSQVQVSTPQEGLVSPQTQPEQAESPSVGPMVAAPALRQPATAPTALAPNAKQPSKQNSANEKGFAASSTAEQSGNHPRSVSPGYPSPDGRWTALQIDQSIVVRDASGTVVFRSHRFEQVQETNVYWLGDQLIYELYRADGMERWRINVQIGQEHKE